MINTWNDKIDSGAFFVKKNELTVHSISIHSQVVPKNDREVTEM